MLGRTAFGEGHHKVAQQHAQVLMVHALNMLHEAWPPQGLGWATCVEGTDIGAHQAQALVHGLPHLYRMQPCHKLQITCGTFQIVLATLQHSRTYACRLRLCMQG